MSRFHTPAYRIGQAQLTHPALGERFTLPPTESWRSALQGLVPDAEIHTLDAAFFALDTTQTKSRINKKLYGC
jgi:hypothetical protein